MDTQVIANYDIFEDKNPALEINNININNVYYFVIKTYHGTTEKYINSQKQLLQLYQCTGQCLSDNICHTCKLALNINDENIVKNCPYVYQITDIKEPKKNSKSYILWHYIKNFLIYRNKFGKYASYLSVNDEFEIDDKLYYKLKDIPEFSLKHAFNTEFTLDEYKEKILQDPKFKYYISSSIKKPFFHSLLNYYIDELERHRDFVNCRILMDKNTVDYLKWKDYHNQALVEIGDYYIITISQVYFTNKLPAFIYYKKNIHNIYLSFLKKDAKLVYEYIQNNDLLPYHFCSQLLRDNLKEILHIDKD